MWQLLAFKLTLFMLLMFMDIAVVPKEFQAGVTTHMVRAGHVRIV